MSGLLTAQKMDYLLGSVGSEREKKGEHLGTMLSCTLVDHIGEIHLCPFPDEKLRLREEK